MEAPNSEPISAPMEGIAATNTKAPDTGADISDAASTKTGSSEKTRNFQNVQRTVSAVDMAGTEPSASGLNPPSEYPQLQRTPTKTNPGMSLFREILLLFVTCNAQLITQAALSQALSPLHIIGPSFGHPSPGQLSWFVASFSLTVGTFILAAGRLGDMFGHRKLFLFGWGWLAIWSLIAGFTVYTGSQVFFDICRAMQGLACAVLLPNAIAILGTTYPPGIRKAMAFSLFGGTAPNGGILGALFGGMLAQLAWWPWAFWLTSIYSVLLLVMAYLVIPSPSNLDSASSMYSGIGIRKFDWLGFATGVTGLILFNVAWNQAPTVGWSSAQAIVLLVLGVILFGIFIYAEKIAALPLVPVDSMGSKVALVLACVMFGWSSFGIWFYYFYQFSEVIEGNTPLNVVARQSPCGISGAMAAITVGLLIHRVKSSWIMMAAMIAFCAGNIILVTNEPFRLYWKQTFWAMIVTPFGMDLSFPAASLLLSNAAPKKHQGMMASLVTTVVNYSIAFGLGIAGTVEANVNDGGRDILKGYRGAWYSAIGLSGLGILCAAYFVFCDYLEEWRVKSLAQNYDGEKQEVEGEAEAEAEADAEAAAEAEEKDKETS